MHIDFLKATVAKSSLLILTLSSSGMSIDNSLRLAGGYRTLDTSKRTVNVVAGSSANLNMSVIEQGISLLLSTVRVMPCHTQCRQYH